MRNLTISKTIDDFAMDTAKLDFDVEDLVSYCEDITNILYWINIESVWGPLGFEWDQYDNYGHFHTNPVKFSILPRIPDPHRIKSFKGIFREIPKDYIIQENDFVNVDTICNWFDETFVTWPPISTTVKFIAPVNNITNIGDKDNYNVGTLHFIGSLEGVTNVNSYFPRLVIDKDNIHELKLPALQILNSPVSMPRQGLLEIYISDPNKIMTGCDLTEVFKEIPDDYVYINSFSNHFPVLCADTVDRESSVFKLYKAQVKDRTVLTSFIRTKHDSKYKEIIYDVNGYENEDVLMVAQTKPERGTVIRFTQEPVNNFCKFCNQDLAEGKIYDTWDFTKENDQKYNLFVNPHSQSEGAFLTYKSYNNGLQLEQPYIYCYNKIDCSAPLKFDINLKVYKQNIQTHAFCQEVLSVQTTVSKDWPRLDLFSNPTQSQVIDFIESNKDNLFLKFYLSQGSLSPTCFLMNDINYLEYDGIDQDICISSTYFKFQDLYNANTIYLNDSIDKFKGVSYEEASVLLIKDIKATNIGTLIIPLECTYKVYPVDNYLSINSIYLFSTNIPKIFDYPELALPISDPENYEHNRSIRQNIRFYPFTKANLVQPIKLSYGSAQGIGSDGRPDSGIYITTDQEFILTSSSMGANDIYLTATTKSKYVNQWDILNNSHLPIIAPLSKILAFDYGNYNFAYTYYFIDEGSDSTQEKAEHMTEFVNKCMRNPAYLGQKDKGEITLNSTQYKLITPEQIDSLVQYGWAVTELKL